MKTGSGQADQVFYASTLIGPIDRVDAIDDYDTVIVILDQIVIVDGRTRMPNVDIDALAVGNLVEVFRFFLMMPKGFRQRFSLKPTISPRLMHAFGSAVRSAIWTRMKGPFSSAPWPSIMEQRMSVG